MFDDGPVLEYGETIVTDELNKKSGYDRQLTAETIRVMNMWMGVTTELYRASTSCRDGYGGKSKAGFNPVDHAAALWYGSSQNPEATDGASLYAWTKRTATLFEGGIDVNEKIAAELQSLQKSFETCRQISIEDLRETEGIKMKHQIDGVTKMMTIPLVQNFIHHLATQVCADL